MNTKLPIFAIMAVSSQLALADAANDPQRYDAQVETEVHETTNMLETDSATTDSRLPPLNLDMASSLQSKIDSQLDFELAPKRDTDQELASTH